MRFYSEIIQENVKKFHFVKMHFIKCDIHRNSTLFISLLSVENKIYLKYKTVVTNIFVKFLCIAFSAALHIYRYDIS